MTSTLLIVQFILAIVITIAILLQKSSSMGLGAYSGSNDSVFGHKGPTNFLVKATFILGFIFVSNTLTLGYLYNQQNNKSITDNVKVESVVPTTPTLNTDTKSAPPAPATK
jgi:preprotein translocase subunit SecG